MRTKPRIKLLLILVWFAVGLSLTAAAERASLSLAGEWRLRLDPQDEGVQAGWAARPLAGPQVIELPGTTDGAGLGFPLDTNSMTYSVPFPVTTRFPGVKEPERADEHGYLVRRHLFVGPAWYEREIAIPDSWAGRSVTFCIERAMWRTEVWLAGRPVGSCDSLLAEHRYALGVLPPGRHRLSVRVDNRMIHNLSTVTHAYGPETQSRWNGMIGALSLEATPLISVGSVTVFPATDRRSVRCVATVANASDRPGQGALRVRLLPEKGSGVLAESKVALNCPPGLATNHLVLQLKQPAEPWDEFRPARYRLQVALEHDSSVDETTVKFGFRNIERTGQELRLNGRRLFLRGTLDCCVYPQTGHPPMTVAEWEKVLGVVKQYGFNHVRYHTWCPPEAAFEAADRLGVYLQPEAPAWVDDWGVNTITQPAAMGRDPGVRQFLETEMRRISAAYGNHPSFLMFAIGNEFGASQTDWGAVNQMVAEMKQLDPRRLYSGCAARRHLVADDFWVTHNSGAAARGVGPAHTDWDFAAAAKASPVPLVAHETGQRPVFPDYPALLPKFTGPLLPLNLARFQRSLAVSGLDGQLLEFVRASARFQFTQYKAEHEAMLRTLGYSGYQLLMLNDFTGQSEALVGMLDPFWETKGVIRSRDVRAWNGPTVVLARFPRFVWTTNETFQARVEVAHYGPADITKGLLTWSLAAKSGKVIARGKRGGLLAPTGSVTPLEAITASLAAIQVPMAVTLSTRFAKAENQWNLWVYPTTPEPAEPAGVLVTRDLDETALRALHGGGKVLLLAHGLRNASAARTGFESVYWSAGWWGNRFSSLGIVCDPSHPALRGFPNEGCSDWQWRDLCSGATTFLLDGAPLGFRPIIQPVPDFHYNALLAHLFEARVGRGSLLVCGYDLWNNLERRPAARQFRNSLFSYLQSAAFRPAKELPLDWVERVFTPAGLARRGAKLIRVDSEDAANGNLAANVLDGDPGTIWHTRWQPTADPMPHELVIDLGGTRSLQGIRCLPRQDQANGRIAEAALFASSDAVIWSHPPASVKWSNTDQWQQLKFPASVEARYLKLVIRSEVNGNAFAALAELELIE